MRPVLEKEVVKLTRSYWSDARGAHMKLSLLRRKNTAFEVMAEDCSMVGAEAVFPRIINLHECKDGIYEVKTCNEKKDWETGLVEGYDYLLVPYTP